MDIISMDSHKKYSQVCVQEKKSGRIICERRIEHARGQISGFLESFEPKTPVAVETVGNWYWIIDEIEQAGMKPRLVHAHKAKLMLGTINKTDKLDARGLNRLQRADTLPTVWIPDTQMRDHRELPRTRMVFTRQRTRLKNRIHSVIDKYGLQDEFRSISDVFGKAGRARLYLCLNRLPKQTQYSTVCMIRQLDLVQKEIERIEKRMLNVFSNTDDVRHLMTLPGVGFILSVVIVSEIGDIKRFATAQHLACYCGTTPRVHSSGGKTYYGKTRSDVNHYLKWAYSEAGNQIAVHRTNKPCRHVSKLYERIRQRRGHGKAIGALGRHLAEATFYILSRNQAYIEPKTKSVSSTTA